MKKIIILSFSLFLSTQAQNIERIAAALTLVDSIASGVDDVQNAIKEMQPKVSCYSGKSCENAKGCQNKQGCAGSIIASFIKLIKPIIDNLLGVKVGDTGLQEGALTLIVGSVAANLSGLPLPKPNSPDFAAVRKALIDSKTTKARAYEYYEKLTNLAISAQDMVNYLNAIVRLLAPSDVAKDLPKIEIPPVTVAEGELPDL